MRRGSWAAFEFMGTLGLSKVIKGVGRDRVCARFDRNEKCDRVIAEGFLGVCGGGTRSVVGNKRGYSESRDGAGSVYASFSPTQLLFPLLQSLQKHCPHVSPSCIVANPKVRTLNKRTPWSKRPKKVGF